VLVPATAVTAAAGLSPPVPFTLVPPVAQAPAVSSAGEQMKKSIVPVGAADEPVPSISAES